MIEPSIDILLPYWGEANLFKKTVDSVLAQTNPNWRLLIFDDCYPSDEAQTYCTSLNDPRIVYRRHEKNIGITNNFNFAVDAAKSNYCSIVGCDDVLLPHYVETALQNIGDADFYQPGVEVIDGNDKVYLPLGDRIKHLLQPRKAGLYSGEKLATSLCHGNWLYFPSIVWRTNSIKRYKFNADYKIVEDVVVELDLIKDGGKLFFDKDHTTFQYRRFANSLSSREKSKGGVRFEEESSAYKHISQVFADRGWKSAARAARWHLTSRLHRLLSLIS
jgi:glycosyltransferase involved in cell wall biosynthesis